MFACILCAVHANTIVPIISCTAACLQITTIDIGGGLSANYCSNEPAMPGRSFSDYAAALAATVPELFTGELHVITEFGRALMAKVIAP
jgi:diaminopimelate decarboxylase